MRFQKLLNPQDKTLSQDAKKFIRDIKSLQPQVKNERPTTTYPTNIARFISFEGIRALDLQRYGEKVQLSEKTIEELVMATIKDPSDTSYMREGRPQRLIKQKVNLAQNNLDIQSKIDVVKQALEQKLVATPSDIQNLNLAVQVILGRMEEKQLTKENLDVIVQAVKNIGLQNAQPTTLDNTKQFYTPAEFIAQKAEIMAYMFAQNPNLIEFAVIYNNKNKPVNSITAGDFVDLLNTNQMAFLNTFRDYVFDIKRLIFIPTSLIQALLQADPDALIPTSSSASSSSSPASSSTGVPPLMPASPSQLESLKQAQRDIQERMKEIEQDVESNSTISASTFVKKGVSGVPKELKTLREEYTDLQRKLKKIQKQIVNA